MIDFSKIKGVIFDNDGVVVNSEPLSCGALRRMFLEIYDTDIGDDFSSVIGTSDTYAMQFYMDLHDLEQPNTYDDLIERKAEIYFDMATEELQPFEGFHELLQYLQPRYDLAIASSGNHDKIKFSLEQVGVSQYFPIICSATEVEHGKPAPDLFEFTAECMGLKPEQCVVVEDSTKGIKGAKSAGMYAIGFTSSFDRETLKASGADLVIDSFPQLQKEIDSNNSR